ncbi:hypothetical protein DVH24_042334 [Malus domestica]|uniref:Uncharacterized protein n=1 Tax=Malus domestica TaxID=3750 RepID=A0A498J335_MALDO|nr:hypothetical protein DVH24_042334 [Malus domestica]
MVSTCKFKGRNFLDPHTSSPTACHEKSHDTATMAILSICYILYSVLREWKEETLRRIRAKTDGDVAMKLHIMTMLIHHPTCITWTIPS